MGPIAIVPLLIALLLLMTACGDDEPSSSETSVRPPAPQPTATSVPPTPTTAPAAPTPAPSPAAPAPTPTAEPTAAPEQPASSGGWLRIAASGSSRDTLSPFFAQSLAEWIAFWGIYDTLAWLVGSEIELGLAESVTPNEDGSEWTIVLKEATFHDGSRVRPEDVAYSLASFADPQMAPFMAPFFANIDTANFAIPDERTLVVPLHSPQGDFVSRTLAVVSIVVPEGSVGGPDAIGSGPFKMEAAEPGKSIRLLRNDDYWDGPPPILDGIEIIVINDANARINALKGGEIEFAAAITPAAAKVEADNPDIELLPAGPSNTVIHSFSANITIPPFDNPDVVRALKLAVDRQAMIDTVLFGYGEVGNDLVGRGLVGYNESIPQVERDIDEARRIFETAGVTELTMLTSEVVPGATAAAEVLAQQLAEAGVKLTLEEVPADQFYVDFMALLQTPLQSSYWDNRPAATHAAMVTGSFGTFNLTGIAGEEYDGLLARLTTEIDPERRHSLAQEVQEYLHEHDGLVVWAYQEGLNASVPGLTGVIYSQSAPRFHRASLEE